MGKPLDPIPGPTDPLVLQAEKIFEQRQARNLVIDPDLLGEPGWDILLCAFIAGGKGSGCRADVLCRDLGLTPRVMQRWIDLLEDRGMIETNGKLLVLTRRAEGVMRNMFSAQIKELMQEISTRLPGFGAGKS